VPIRIEISAPPPMSALGQKQTSAHVRVMSALPPRADIRCRDQLRGGWDQDYGAGPEPWT